MITLRQRIEKILHEYLPFTSIGKVVEKEIEDKIMAEVRGRLLKQIKLPRTQKDFSGRTDVGAGHGYLMAKEDLKKLLNKLKEEAK